MIQHVPGLKATNSCFCLPGLKAGLLPQSRSRGSTSCNRVIHPVRTLGLVIGRELSVNMIFAMEFIFVSGGKANGAIAAAGNALENLRLAKITRRGIDGRK